MPRNVFTLSLLSIGILASQHSAAQSSGLASTISSPDSLAARTNSLSPVEVRGIRAAADAPFAKTEISGAVLQKDNLGQDLPFLLQYTPSAVVTSDAGAGVGYTSLRIRGTDNTRINTTLNGIPVNDAESSGTYFVDLPDLASSTTSIQIQRGVGTSTNGAGAFGGTVSVANLMVSALPAAEANISYGSFNTQKYTVSAGTDLINDRFALNVRLSQLSSNGYIDRSASFLQSFQINAAWKLSSRTTLQAMVMQGTETTHQAWNGVSQDSLSAHRTYNELGQKADGSFYDNQVDHYRQNYYQLFLDHRFTKKLTGHIGLFLTRGIGYYEEYKTEQTLADYGLQPFITPIGDTLATTDLIRQLWLDNYNYGTVYSLLWDAGKHTKVTLGGGWNQYIGNHYGYITWAQLGAPDHYRYYKLDAQKNDFNIYLKAEHRIGNNIVLYGDLQERSVGYFMNGFRYNPSLRPAVSYTFFNPKAGITYFIRNNATQRQKAYASFAIANKEPNRDDFEASLTSLPKPERLYDAEGGYEVSSRNWSAGFNAYYMNYKDQLVLTGKINDVGSYTRTNVPNSYRAGLEIQAAYKPVSILGIFANATFSKNKIKDFTEYVDDYDNGGQQAIFHGTTDIAFSPSVIASGGLSLTPFTSPMAKGFAVELLAKSISRQYLDNTSNDARSISPYTLCDLRLRWSAAVKPFSELGLTLAVNNLLDKRYESNGYTFSYIAGQTSTTQNYYYPQAGTNVLLGLHLKW
jgi:iron complex outermembrane receptor protein